MGFLTDLATHIKTWANGRFQTLLPTPVGNSGKVVSSDGTAFVLTTPSSGGGLTNFTEARTTTAPNATIPVHSIKATGAETNIDIAIVPKGAGALTTQIADGTATGGNKRGSYAVDFQMYRTLNTQIALGTCAFIGNGSSNKASANFAAVCCGSSNSAIATNAYIGGGDTNTASGNYSVVTGGQNNVASDLVATVNGGKNNTASGSISCVAGGFYNTASAQYTFVAGGFYTYAYLYGQAATGNANATQMKVRQDSKIAMQGSTATATAAEIFIYSTNRAVLKNNCAWAFDITILAHSSTNVLHTARFKRSGLILRGASAATTTLEGAVQTIGTDIINSNLTGCAVAISADTTNGSLKVEVTGIASTTIVWQAKIELVEIEI